LLEGHHYGVSPRGPAAAFAVAADRKRFLVNEVLTAQKEKYKISAVVNRTAALK